MMDVGTLVARAARMYSRSLALECENEVRSYADVNSNANRFANVLRGLGYRAGVRIAVLLRNCIEFPEIEFGIAKAGLISVQINPMLNPKDIGSILRDSDAALVVCGAALLDTVESIRANIPASAFVVVGGDNLPQWADRYEALLAAATDADPGIHVTGDTLCRIAYTSGTTGQPKGVMLSHSAVSAVAYNLLLELGPVWRGQRLLHLQPLCHGTGMFVLPWFIRGGVSVIHTRFDAERVIEARKREHIDFIKLVPTMYVRLVEQGEGRLEELRGVQSIIYGASPMPAEPLRRGIERLGPVFSEVYGQTESPMTITVLAPQEHFVDGAVSSDRLRSAGRPWTNVDVRIVGGDGEEVPQGEPGEVIVAGPQNMVGYWRRPEDTAKTLVDGWIHTRDIGTFDDQGYLYLLDRQDDMIITGGLNVYPRQVEEVLFQHASVSEAVVVGVQDDHWGERIVALVCLKPNLEVDARDLIAFCRDRLTGYKTPKEIVFAKQIPKTPFGKVSRKQAREEIARHRL
jgi:long-chain acyl-CoA synthetase